MHIVRFKCTKTSSHTYLLGPFRGASGNIVQLLSTVFCFGCKCIQIYYFLAHCLLLFCHRHQVMFLFLASVAFAVRKQNMNRVEFLFFKNIFQYVQLYDDCNRIPRGHTCSEKRTFIYDPPRAGCEMKNEKKKSCLKFRSTEDKRHQSYVYERRVSLQEQYKKQSIKTRYRLVTMTTAVKQKRNIKNKNSASNSSSSIVELVSNAFFLLHFDKTSNS